MGKGFVACTGYESDPFFELTLWAVLMLRDDLAVLLWRYTEDPIRCCLVSLLMFYRFLILLQLLFVHFQSPSDVVLFLSLCFTGF